VAERVLTTRQLNRALLARQLLLDRPKLSPTRVLERVAGLQTQYAPSAYIGLWTRVRSFKRDALTNALEQRRIVQGTLMRATIHIVSARDYPFFAEGIRRDRRELWLRAIRRELQATDMRAVADLVRRHLADGPRRQAELVELLKAEGYPRVAWSGAGLWLDMIRMPPSGTWERRRADLFGVAEDWLGTSEVSEEAGLEFLVRRYLGGFGPARLNDLANWAGVQAATLRPIVERLNLRRFRDEEGGELLDLKRAPLPDADTPAPVRFLPTWDAALLVHARRTQILPEEYRALVFNTKTPQSVPTFLVDGAVAGTWRYESGRVQLTPFDPLPRAARRDLADESQLLAAFHAL
jgi:Winged helix DNA-binding domain